MLLIKRSGIISPAVTTLLTTATGISSPLSILNKTTYNNNYNTINTYYSSSSYSRKGNRNTASPAASPTPIPRYTNKRTTTVNNKFKKETIFVDDPKEHKNNNNNNNNIESEGITSSITSPIAPKGAVKFNDHSKQVKQHLENDYKIEQELIKDSKSYFANISNHSKYIKWLANRLRYRVPTDWYKVKRMHFLQNYGENFLLHHRYQDDHIKAVVENHPNERWYFWKFSTLKSSFWRDNENKREYIKWMANIVGKNQSIDEWHYLTDQDFQKNHGSYFIDTYGDVPSALANVYPEHPWKPWLFERCDSSYFKNNIDNQRNYLNWLAETLKITSTEQWYQLTSKDFKINKGFHLLKLYHNSPSQMITTILNNGGDSSSSSSSSSYLQSWRFKVIPKKKINILILKDFINHLDQQLDQQPPEQQREDESQQNEDIYSTFKDKLSKYSTEELNRIIENNHGIEIINEFGGTLNSAIESLIDFERKEEQQNDEDELDEPHRKVSSSSSSSFEDSYEFYDIDPSSSNAKDKVSEQGEEEEKEFDWDDLALLDRQNNMASTKYKKNVTNKKKKKK